MLRRAFSEFMTIPTVMVLAFLLLAVGTTALDRVNLPWLEAVRQRISTFLFINPDATSSLLSAVAGGVITITSITFSVLLLAVQQSASSLTFEVLDQFLQRKLNQVFFGFFVGLALYSVGVLATVSPDFNPVLGAVTVLLLTVVALYFLIFLIYSTISQMRPEVISKSIHDHALNARERQLHLIRRTRRTPGLDLPAGEVVRSSKSGFVTAIDVDAIVKSAERASGRIEVVLSVSVGSFVAFGDTLAEIKAEAEGLPGATLHRAVERAVELEFVRDLERDPVHGVGQLVNIAWTSISTSKQNPAAGQQVIQELRDLLARWVVHAHDDAQEAPPAGTVQVVYPDNLLTELVGAFESLAVVSSESMQAQSFTEVVAVYANMFQRLPHEQQEQVDDAVLRILSTLGDEPLTRELGDALSRLATTLSEDRPDTASAVREARDMLAASIGKLNSRSTRVPSGG